MRRLLIGLVMLGACVVAYATDGSARKWEFDLRTAGTYKVQVEHPADESLPSSTKVAYSFQIGTETQGRELDLIAGRPYIPLILDIPGPKKMQVSITGLPSSALRRTRVYVFHAATVPPGEYYDPKKHDFKEVRQVRALLNQPAEAIDLARVKVTIDKMIDPGIDAEATLKKIDTMVAQIGMTPGFGPLSAAKLTAVQKYIYQSGPWNDYRPYRYDLDDPLGRKLSNKLLASYIDSKNGNCVTMPLLFVILGQRFGVDVTLAMAPAHFFVKFNSDDRGWINLEATSGATPTRDIWMRGQFPAMTDQSIASGLYMQPLSKKEAAAAIVETLGAYYLQQAQYDKAMAVADLVLEYYPKSVSMMILKGTAFGRISGQYFPQYIDPARTSPADMAYFQNLSQGNRVWFAKAEALGWREETPEEERQYLQNVNKAKQQQH